MFFYASLFLSCIVVAAVALWLFRAMSEAAKSVYRSMLPSARRGLGKTRAARLEQSTQGSPTPWGWSGKGPRRARPMRAPGFARAALASLSQSQKPDGSGKMQTDERPGVKKPWGW